MKKTKILDAASVLTPAKFIIWAEDMGLNPIIENSDEVYNVNTDDEVIIKMGRTRIVYNQGKLNPAYE